MDKYTYLHFAVGVVMYYLGFSLTLTIVLHIIFEVVENTPEGIRFINRYMAWFWPGGKDEPDASINMIGDTCGAALGWLSACTVDMFSNEK